MGSGGVSGVGGSSYGSSGVDQVEFGFYVLHNKLEEMLRHDAISVNDRDGVLFSTINQAKMLSNYADDAETKDALDKVITELKDCYNSFDTLSQSTKDLIYRDIESKLGQIEQTGVWSNSRYN